MATYKVIQDIEAEDKLVGPLTLRQFIYAGVAAVCLYICFLAYTKGVPFLIGIFLPIALASGFFGFPWKGEQPTEIWALARVRFMLKPRVRIWDQDGAKDLVTVIAPKVVPVQRSYKADMSQSEVRSRLKALADTIDSRGWATRNAAYGSVSQQWQSATVVPPDSAFSGVIPNEDMFDTKSSVAQNFDALLNKSQVQLRQRVEQELAQAQTPQPALQAPQQAAYNYGAQLQPQPTTGYVQNDTLPFQQPAMYPTQDYQPYPQPPAATAQMNQPAVPPQIFGQPQTPTDSWFTSGPAYPVNPQPQLPMLPTPQPSTTMPIPSPTSVMGQPYVIDSEIAPPTAADPTAEEYALAQSLKQQRQNDVAINYSHMRVLQPVSQQNSGVPIDYSGASSTMQPATQPQPSIDTPQQPPVTRTPDPAILSLANNDDLDVATIARQANKELGKSPDEVEIRLH